MCAVCMGCSGLRKHGRILVPEGGAAMRQARLALGSLRGVRLVRLHMWAGTG